MGQITNNVISKETVCLPREKGGLGIPNIRIKCRALFIKQLLRTISGRKHGRDHIDFWLGNRLRIPSLDFCFYHLKGKIGKETDCTPPIYLTTLDYITEALEDDVFSVSDITDITTKCIYLSLLESIPPPKVEAKYPDYDWPLIWVRLKSGVFSPAAKSFLYLILHDRVSTKERGHRLMPGRFPSPFCTRCDSQVQVEETCSHRYLHCERVSEAWEWVRTVLVMLEPSTGLLDDISVLRLCFSRSMRENALLWVIGVFIVLVETEVVTKDNKLDHNSLLGYFRQRKQQSNLQAIPELGPIPGIDWAPTGIG